MLASFENLNNIAHTLKKIISCLIPVSCENAHPVAMAKPNVVRTSVAGMMPFLVGMVVVDVDGGDVP